MTGQANRSSVQRIVRGLEIKGYVERIARKDTRRTQASLTNKYDLTGLVNAVETLAKENLKK